jgi:DnaJ family protein C protein 13
VAWEQFLQELGNDKLSVTCRWNQRTRQELALALEKEATALQEAREEFCRSDGLTSKRRSMTSMWNHEEFAVPYPSLERLLCVDGIFLSEALEALDKHQMTPDDFFALVPDVVQFVMSVYRKYVEHLHSAEHLDCSLLAREHELALIKIMVLVFTQRMGALEGVLPFYGIGELVTELRRHTCAVVRDALLTLFTALLAHKRNAQEFMRCNGVAVLVHMAAIVHLDRQATSRQAAALTSNLLEAGQPAAKASEEYRYWYKAIGGASKEAATVGRATHDAAVAAVAGVAGVAVSPAPQPQEQALLLSEISSELKSRELTVRSRLRPKDEASCRTLQDIPQLAWSVGVDWTGGADKADVALACLHLLHALCALFPSADGEGRAKLPKPLIRRILLADDCLCHIVQLVLAGYPQVVDRAMALLEDMLQCAEHSCVRKLYRTGFFLFALAYTGSNLHSIASILKKTHLRQDFYRKDADRYRAGGTAMPVSASSSILHELLPESLICFLRNHAPAAFASMLLADSDTPEAIWHNKMRMHLIGSISTHIIDFTLRLREDFLACYEYVPLLSPVRYTQLDGELWCEPYFLRNLVKTEVFASWPIQEPFHLLRAVLDLWNRQEEAEARAACEHAPINVQEAYAKLGVEQGADEHQIRKAYRTLAVIYHPDKNPAGREEFELLNKAYQLLTTRAQQATAQNENMPTTLDLLIKTQTIVYQRCAHEVRVSQTLPSLLPSLLPSRMRVCSFSCLQLL